MPFFSPFGGDVNPKGGLGIGDDPAGRLPASHIRCPI
jgi:hypothetical protein